MKTAKVLRILVIISILFVISACAKSTQIAQDTKSERMSVAENKDNITTYGTDDWDCIVSVHNEKWKLEAISLGAFHVDEQTVRVIQHIIQIWLDKNSLPQKQEEWNILTVRNQNIVSDSQFLSKPNIFYMKCLKAVKDLPEEVRKKFLGFYGVK